MEASGSSATDPSVCLPKTLVIFESVIGVNGWFRIGDSLSSSSWTNRWPRYVVRPCSGEAGHTRVVSSPSASSSASATGPMLPAGVESNVEQYLK